MSTERVKIFTGGTHDEFDELEQRVNAWLANGGNVEITSRHVIGAAGENAEGKGFVNCTIVIFYNT